MLANSLVIVLILPSMPRAMNRFHSSMSWNDSAAPDQCGPDASDHDAAAMDGPTWLAGSSDEAWSSETDHPEEGDQWAHFAGHRSFFLPLHYEPNYRYPLIIWLHSDGFNENQVDHVMPHISVRNYVAAGVRGVRAADSVGHRFDWHDSPAAIQAAHEAVAETIEQACSQFSIHDSRIVLAGYGSGGTMALRIAMRQSEQFAAVVSLGGKMPHGGQAINALSQLRRRRLAMLWAWAAENPRFNPNSLRSDIQLAMMIKASLEVRQYPTDDEMDTVVLSDVNQWIMRQVIADPSGASSDRWASSPTAYSSN